MKTFVLPDGRSFESKLDELVTASIGTFGPEGFAECCALCAVKFFKALGQMNQGLLPDDLLEAFEEVCDGLTHLLATTREVNDFGSTEVLAKLGKKAGLTSLEFHRAVLEGSYGFVLQVIEPVREKMTEEVVNAWLQVGLFCIEFAASAHFMEFPEDGPALIRVENGQVIDPAGGDSK